MRNLSADKFQILGKNVLHFVTKQKRQKKKFKLHVYMYIQSNPDNLLDKVLFPFPHFGLEWFYSLSNVSKLQPIKSSPSKAKSW